jgi:hypothetical protein
MSTLGVVAVVVVSAWLAMVTVVAMLCVRQLGALTVRLDLVARGGGGSHAHGAAVGFRLNEQLVELYPPLATGRRVLLLISSTCTTCARLVEEFRSEGPPPSIAVPDEFVVLLAGPEEEQAETIAEVFADISMTIRDPLATQVARGLRLANVPSALLLDDGVITGSLQFVDHVAQLDELVSGKPTITIETIVPTAGAVGG